MTHTSPWPEIFFFDCLMYHWRILQAKITLCLHYLVWYITFHGHFYTCPFSVYFVIFLVNHCVPWSLLYQYVFIMLSRQILFLCSFFNSSYFKSSASSFIHSALLPIPYPIFDLYDLISHDSHIALTWNFFLWLSYVSLKDFASKDHSLFALSRVIYNFSWPFLYLSVFVIFSYFSRDPLRPMISTLSICFYHAF